MTFYQPNLFQLSVHIYRKKGTINLRSYWQWILIVSLQHIYYYCKNVATIKASEEVRLGHRTWLRKKPQTQCLLDFIAMMSDCSPTRLYYISCPVIVVTWQMQKQLLHLEWILDITIICQFIHPFRKLITFKFSLHRMLNQKVFITTRKQKKGIYWSICKSKEQKTIDIYRKYSIVLWNRA